MGMRCGTRTSARSGVTAVLAMLYLTLMASLALGFYSASNTALIVSTNEQRVERARMAAETGLDFARFHLTRVSLPPKAPLSKHFELMTDQMETRLNSSGNLENGNIYTDATTIRVPAEPNKYIKADDKGSEFQFIITDISDAGGRKVRVTSVGRNIQASAAGIRTLRLDFAVSQKNSKIFQYGIATRGTVTAGGNSRLLGQPNPDKGSILATNSTSGNPVIAGGKLVSGDISITNPKGNVSVSGSVGGTNDPAEIPNHIHKGVDEPEFPTVDTSMFLPYATNLYTPGKSVYSNIVIPPNTNPTFNAGVQLNGVVYIKAPNQVKFNGHASIQGVIVTDDGPQPGNLSTNTLTFNGGFDAQGVETLPASYGDLRSLSGSFMLMPGFSLSMSGNFDAHAHGSIVVDKASMTGSANVKLDGSLVILQDTPMSMGGNSELTAGDNALGFPAGLKFSNRYFAIPATYEETKNPN
jgi:hypothetical protein